LRNTTTGPFTASRSLPCSIADKVVNITLRHGSGVHEPAKLYVRCEERDCQYVDLNQAPCPLRVEMFDDGSHLDVAGHLTEHTGTRFCYACLCVMLAITHDQVRRASWRLQRDVEGLHVNPSRCSVCRRRRVTIGIMADSAALAVPAPRKRTEPKVVLTGTVPEQRPQGTIKDGRTGTVESQSHRRVVESLLISTGDWYCASCVAFGAEIALGDAKAIAGNLTLMEFERRTAACSICGRRQAVIRAVKA
jgi:hypothetical protein